MTAPLTDFTVSPTVTLLEAAKVMEANRSRTAVVLDDDTRKVIGILSDGDVLRALLAGADVHAPIRAFIKVSFTYLQSPDKERARILFATHGFGLIPVVDADMHLQSVITLLETLQS